jgi:trehalose 6-phosphate phosphatase
MAASALARLGMTGPALKFLDWVLGILDQTEPPALLRPVYTVTGGHLGSEGEIGELAGYRGSRPVRVGNAAAQQIQLDVLGPIADLVALLAARGAPLSSEHWRMLSTMVEAVAARWHEADHGIWEVRRPRQHHVHSKVMCWQTVDRALRVGEYLGRRKPDWEALRDQIAADVLERGRHPEGWIAGTYAQAEHAGAESAVSIPAMARGAGQLRPGEETSPFRRLAVSTLDEVDAATLTLGLSGLLAADDPRFRSTIEAVERHLRVGSTVYRYRYDDGLPGIEGGFNLCTAWLIEAHTMVGRHDDARRLFEQYTAMAGPAGLLAEEYDPVAGQSLGNYPQAYSHLGLINAALALDSSSSASSV